MRLIMTLVVRDEADLIETQIAYHRAQGVDHFLVLDHRSVDATPQILQSLAQTGDLTLFRDDSLARYQGQWVTQLARLAAREHGADWVINNDADEFWWSDRGSLKEVLTDISPQHRLALAQRHNFVALRSDLTADNAPRPFWQSMIYRQQNSVNFLGEPLSSKLCHRGEPEIVVHHGNHSVAPMTTDDLWPETAFEIFHYPVRDLAQFERKVRNGGGSWVANASLSPDIGRGKRHLYEAYLTGQLPQIFAQWCYAPQELKQALDAGQLCEDLRLRNFLQTLTSV